MSKEARGNRPAVPLQDMAIFTAVLLDGLPSIWGHTKHYDNPVGIVEPIALGPYETPSPIQLEASRYDLEHMYPTRMKVLGVNPHPTTPKLGVTAFRDGKPTSYEAIETPGYLTIPRPSLDALGRHIDSRKRPEPTLNEISDFVREATLRNEKINVQCQVDPNDPYKMQVDLTRSGAPAEPLNMDALRMEILGMGLKAIRETVGVLGNLGNPPPGPLDGYLEPTRKFSWGRFQDRYVDDKHQPVYREIPGYENRLDVLSMLRRQRFNETTSPESYALDKVLRRNPHVMVVVFERRVEGKKRNRYSKCIQDIVLRNKP